MAKTAVICIATAILVLGYFMFSSQLYHTERRATLRTMETFLEALTATNGSSTRLYTSLSDELERMRTESTYVLLVDELLGMYVQHLLLVALVAKLFASLVIGFLVVNRDSLKEFASKNAMKIAMELMTGSSNSTQVKNTKQPTTDVKCLTTDPNIDELLSNVADEMISSPREMKKVMRGPSLGHILDQ